jgi:isoleucyl-tRNA synthetase
MDFQAEATIVSELLKFAESGQLYRGAKPVMWSPVEKTALADAEVEYADIISTQIDVAFEIMDAPNAPELVGAYAVIWTTTPWTIPVNQGIAYGEAIEYVLIALSNEAGEARKYVVAKELREAFLERVGFWDLKPLMEGESIPGYNPGLAYGVNLAGAVARHPMHHLGDFFAKPRPFLPGEFVTTDAGTGLVHMAPDHGEDDFALCKAHGINPVFAVEGDGRYRADWLWLGGESKNVINPNLNAPDGPICNDLRAAGALLSAAPFSHSYPHSWRSKKKVIFRCTPQWFVPMDKGDNTLRQKAVAAIAATQFTPDKGRNRIGAMVEGRPDWVLSRQRAWGVPITLFVDRKTGDYLVDSSINQKIVAAFREKGVDAWTPELAAELLGDRVDQYEQITDILDVWFDSGCTHAFVLESGRWPELQWPADLYLEGSDQHRGWFQSSLLQSCGTRGRAPYNAILTHGFTMDASGRKMSKSEGNVINPLDIMKTNGADILRLWALSVDFTEDHRIGDEILKGVADQYRKLRNNFRYLLGALDGWNEAERLPAAEMPALERWVLHRLAELSAELKTAAETYDFNRYVSLITGFVQDDLSAFAMDVRKDSLYCDAATAPTRRAWRTVLDTLFHALTRWLAPVLAFTAEEVWGTRFPNGGSVHLLEWPEIDAGWRDDALASDMAFIRQIRVLAFSATEKARREKFIGANSEAEIVFTFREQNTLLRFSNLIKSGLFSIEELFITGAVTAGYAEGAFAAPLLFVDGKASSHVISDEKGLIAAAVVKSTDPKCARCWRHLPDVAEDTQLCGRCDTVVHA